MNFINPNTNSKTNSKINDETNIKSILVGFLCKIEGIIFNLTEKNLDSSFEEIMVLHDTNFPYTCDLIISNLIYYAFYCKKGLDDLFLIFLERIQTKELEINKNKSQIIKIFSNILIKNKTQESYYLMEKMIEKRITLNINSEYFAHYKSKNKKKYYSIFDDVLRKTQEERSKNDWELHKKLIKEGVNPNEIAKIIRNDEIEKLQEITSQTKFDFNQTIKPSLYERCSFINKKNVSLIDYAAFFGSVKCFKFLLMNGANVNNAGKYAVAGGNLEIIHLCEQNHSSFKNTYKTAIRFHRNDIFMKIKLKKLMILKK